ncbi:histidine phosphatase family protein [Aureibacillus halotolerans]|uniref:Broad-specificity phosphatase PhoE n=1 Tax=Aureibacillus halotolerans TaxID=1508390 RepID=A0A4R6U874_9BACI|nr:histidine phosphatase family protein [Aureibacillus halotolerans]TDQ40805.1 broad-specificity phosphatase PhoE [Aureibacillus halotolerans]
MTTICLVRHGETDWNAAGRIQGSTDIPLNQTGIEQARKCREFLKNASWDVLITSPLLRAKETATIVNEALQLPLVEMAAFKERSFGDAEGMTAEERKSAYPDKNYPNQEPYDSLRNRVVRGIEDIYAQHVDKSVLLVAHGAVISAILSQYSNGEYDFEKTRLINACISNIHFRDGAWLVHDYNQIDHLS